MTSLEVLSTTSLELFCRGLEVAGVGVEEWWNCVGVEGLF